ncbi:MAG: type II secretion system F family protein [Planctomycetota bacterium]
MNPTMLVPSPPTDSAASHRSRPITARVGLTPRPRPDQVLWIVRQLASLYRAGIPLVTAIELTEHQCGDPALRRTLEAVAADLRQGSPLSEAVQKHPRVFGPILRGAITAGESGGVLEQALESALEWMQREDETRRGIKKALFYPSMVAVAFVGAVIAVLTLVVPAFRPLFDRLGDDLPFATRALLTVENMVNRRGLDTAIVLVGLVLATRFLAGRDNLVHAARRIAWHLPRIGEIVATSGLARLAATLGLLQKAGLPLVRCLEIGREVVGVGPLGRDVERLRVWVIRGGRLSDGVATLPSFSRVFRELAAIGESSGQLDHLLLEFARHSCIEVRDRVEKLMRLIEPALTTALALFVLGLALAVLSPYWRLLDAFASG